MPHISDQVLNQPLYDQLTRRFGVVRVARRGEERIVRYIPHPQYAGRLQEQVVQRGEQYYFDCPICGDDRHRSYVSYQYGQLDAHGRPQFGLWYCQNDTHCHKDPTNRNRLQALLAVPLGRQARLLPPVYSPPETDQCYRSLPTFQLPAASISLRELADSHPAVEYLRSRGFCPAMLSETWGLAYVEGWSPAASNRILIPVYRPEPHFGFPGAGSGSAVLAGWQARFIGEPPTKQIPKYLFPTGFPKSKLLYGLVQAKQTSSPVAICEGVSDVWRCGPGAAVATFGKEVSREQKLLLVHHFVGRPLVVMLDENASDTALELALSLRRMRAGQAGDNRVVVGHLAEGRSDPGSCSHEELRSSVWAALSVGGTK